MTTQEQITDIFNNFDFEKCQAYMQSVGWTWSNPDFLVSAVPTVEQLKETATELLNDVAFNGHPYSSTGGLSAYRNGEHIGLAFYIEDWDTAFNEEEAPFDPTAA